MLKYFQILKSYFQTILQNPKYVLNNNYSCIQLSFVFLLQKDYYFDPDDIDGFYFLFFIEIFIFLLFF